MERCVSPASLFEKSMEFFLSWGGILLHTPRINKSHLAHGIVTNENDAGYHEDSCIIRIPASLCQNEYSSKEPTRLCILE